MTTITVYKVRAYDIRSDEFQVSRRMATEQGAAIMSASIVGGSQVEIDASQLEPGQQWTARDFNPYATKGFQRLVTT